MVEATDAAVVRAITAKGYKPRRILGLWAGVGREDGVWYGWLVDSIDDDGNVWWTDIQAGKTEAEVKRKLRDVI